MVLSTDEKRRALRKELTAEVRDPRWRKLLDCWIHEVIADHARLGEHSRDRPGSRLVVLRLFPPGFGSPAIGKL
jgi:hypothetical protein